MESTVLLIAFGTRPEWIKIKPVIDAIEGVLPYRILFTGQHTSIIDYSVQRYKITKLEIENECEERLDSIVVSILKQLPAFHDVSHVMVQGDTTSAFAVALAAFHRQIPVIHLEAGLRTHDLQNPYPEEFNRSAITALADIHLCPTWSNLSDIKRCRCQCSKIYITGNTVLDSLVGLEPTVEDFVLVTMHRRENHDILDQWFTELNKLAGISNNMFVLPIHPNPNVQKHRDLLTNVRVIAPTDHTQCIDLVRRCKYVITDSGGIQEESSFLKKKCVVCRKVSERKEGIGTFAFMCESPTDLIPIAQQIEISNQFIVDEPCPYGDGYAAQKIRDILIKDIL